MTQSFAKVSRSEDLIRAAAPKQPALAHSWFMVGALSLASMVSYIDRQILTLLFTPIKEDLALSDTQVSLLAGLAFVLLYATVGLIMGWLADRTTRKKIIIWGIAFWSVATAACGAAQNFVQLFIARMGVGVGESTLGPSAMSMISDSFPREKLPHAMSIFVSAAFVGMGLALVLGAAGVQAAMSLPPIEAPILGLLQPWQMAFMIVGTVGALAIVPMLFVTEPRRTGLARIADAPGTRWKDTGLIKFMTLNRLTFFCFFVGFSMNAVVGMGTIAWLPTFFIREHGWAAHEIGYAYGAVVSIVGLAGVLLGPRFADVLVKRGFRDVYIRYPLYCLLIAQVFSLLSFMVPDARVAIGLVAIKQFITTLPMATMAAALQLITPNQFRGQVSAIYSFVGQVLAVATGPVIVALITDFVFHDEAMLGESIMTMIAISIPIAAILLWIGVRPFRESLERAEAEVTAEADAATTTSETPNV
jgi:MFS family permease